MSRSYNKKSSYWNRFSKGAKENGASNLEDLINNNSESEPSFVGDSFYESSASYERNNFSGSGDGNSSIEETWLM
jgi:hypothetical protein